MPRIVSTAILGSRRCSWARVWLLPKPTSTRWRRCARPAGSNPLDPMTALSASASSAKEAEAGNADFEGLPDGPGAEETYYQCVACHSTEIIKQQRVTDLRWDELWDWMAKSQGMVEPDEETKAVILAYLKQHFSSER
ncbi:cytochrome C-552 [Paracoccus cavernae]|uniref:Cytochrome C-552 n=1 Tax=Paracoccus cavernae TaxID=1571207 RepID=A0ABT8D3X5_9RHOB|nr:cytochrome C-552 [Paracoccus cavernae]